MVVSTERPLRVLVTSTPGVGHLGPLAPLASALQAAGHQVLWATAEEACDRVRAMGFDTVACGMGVGGRVAALAPQMPEIMALDPRQRRQRLFVGFFAENAAPRMCADLTAVFDSLQPDVVIHEMAELAAAPMSAGRGILHVTVAFSGALHQSVLGGALDAMDQIWVANGVADASISDIFGALYLHPFPGSFGPPPPDATSLLMRPGSVGDPGDAPDWLNALGERPLVYLTAGTERVALAAPWVAAFEALAALDVDVVATIGPMLEPASLGTVPANVHIERFVPQQLLLSRAAVVASHGGAGTVLGAAAHGVPQVLYPIAADQWENADAVARAGAGVVCELDDREATALAAAFQRALDDTEMHKAAGVVADEIAAMPTAAEHVAAIEALVS